MASSIIFERRLRTFERLLVAPVSYIEIILAKLLVGSLFGLFVALVSLALVSHFMVYPVWNVPMVVGYAFLGGLAFSGLALYISLVVENPISAMTWLNLLRLPMMFTSGAIASLLLFPRWFLIAGYLTPMTYLVEGLRFSMLKYTEVVHPVYSALILIFLTLLFTYLSIERLKTCTERPEKEAWKRELRPEPAASPRTYEAPEHVEHHEGYNIGRSH